VERIFVHSCEATTNNLCKSLVDFLIGFNMTFERFERKNPLYKIVRNYRSRYSKQLSKGTTLKWFGLDYDKELKKTKSEVHKASKSQIMSRFMKKIRKGLLEREKRSLKDMFSIITKKVCWDENVGVRFVSNSVDKSSKLDESRMLNLYIRKGTLAVCKEFELQNTENSNEVIKCYHELLFSEVIMYYIIYIIATVHFNKRFQSYIHIYYIILSIVLYIILCITAICEDVLNISNAENNQSFHQLVRNRLTLVDARLEKDSGQTKDGELQARWIYALELNKYVHSLHIIYKQYYCFAIKNNLTHTIISYRIRYGYCIIYIIYHIILYIILYIKLYILCYILYYLLYIIYYIIQYTIYTILYIRCYILY
jgi:hypothetical protein